ncbi:hypothetical protein DESPIG_02368 [Desulfovibrio piger ATCC 29098]|uniref:Uncharacterized protein n=1 Tax=Desulfovibrio piger ATCC 29098 TaxID=411464 RepID=B6WWA0_9BACT|nr:hypothetical protein DESPIG_02368 [Desulfovibrio piger ATCC 29098]
MASSCCHTFGQQAWAPDHGATKIRQTKRAWLLGAAPFSYHVRSGSHARQQGP